jgi:selenium metabolism protein YedF
MEVVTLDCKGLVCPQPVLKTKEALEQGMGKLTVIVDNEASRENVARFARSRHCEVDIKSMGQGIFHLNLLLAGEPVQAEFSAEDYGCKIPGGGGLVYVVSSDSMGRGSDELGWALLQTYIQTIEQIEPLPRKILCYNAGVKLVTEGSGALEALRKLQQKGVEIFACGTCLDFFQLKSALQVGHISNMYDIMTAMSEADQVVSPF